MGDVTFRCPPLVEVSFGVRFPKPPDLHSAHFGLFWAQIRNEFTVTADQPPILDTTSIGQTIVSAEPFISPRVWLIHKEKALLIQLQADRFYLNWRRLQPDAEYPRFAKLLPEFERYATMWRAFLDQQGLGSLEPSGCELSYINHLMPQKGWSNLSEAGNVLRPLVGSELLSGQGPPHAISWAGIFNLQTSRMTASVNTFENAKDRTQKALQFEIKAEPLVDVSSIARMLNWYESANVDVVSVFTSLSTEWAQAEVWGRVSS